ncbi:early nodulin-like protein 1 [Alnus glutinosa]|uniref:early nodulin-like protein 1 n=1 Tax=Alnus glutinosa TaxID=3517 RepID=UPI002D782AE7|nr:early nodulin-like protein 1 [Alnus glutinosa]
MPPRKKPNSSSSSSSSSKKSNPTNQPQPSKFGIQHFFQRHTQNGENVLLASRNPKPSSPSNAAVSTSHNPATDAPSSAPEKSGLPVRNPINYPENAPDLQKPDATHAVSASRDPKSWSGSQANDPNSASQNMPTDNIVVMDVSSDEEDLSEGSQVNDPNSGSLTTPTDNIAVMDVSSDESLSEGSQF